MYQYKFKINYQGNYLHSWGYAIYSAFLEHLPEDLSLAIHEGENFNQHITRDYWLVNSDQPLVFKDEYLLHKYNIKIELVVKDVREISEQELADKYLAFDPYQRKIRINFQTPTSFKQDGEFVLFPTAELIMQSLTNKWNAWALDYSVEDIVWDNCKIDRYNLRSIPYELKGAKVKGFVGYVDLFFWGSESIIRLANMLCHYGEFAGVGVKAALGMGGITIGYGEDRK